MSCEKIIEYSISFNFEKVDSSDIVDLFKELLKFRPTKLDIRYYALRKNKRDTFFKIMSDHKLIKKHGYFSAYPSDTFCCDRAVLDYFPSTNIVRIKGGILEKEGVDIRTLESCFDKFSLNHSIIYARIRIDKEVYWNDSTSLKHAQKYHPELPDIKTIGREPMIKVDTEQFPGHSHHYDGIYFGCCYEMWFGKDYDKYIPLEKLKSFDQCKLNETLDNGTVHIVLYDSPDDFASEKSVANAWAFRKHTECDKAADYWQEQVKELSKGLGNQVYEINEGEFPHGGIRLFKIYLDENGNHVPKHDAVKVHISERGADGKVIFAQTVEISSIK